MPAIESRTTIPTLDSRAPLGGVAAGPTTSILPGHGVTVTQPEGPRNPVMRALQRVGQFLDRKITAVLPQFGRANRFGLAFGDRAAFGQAIAIVDHVGAPFA